MKLVIIGNIEVDVDAVKKQRRLVDQLSNERDRPDHDRYLLTDLSDLLDAIIEDAENEE